MIGYLGVTIVHVSEVIVYIYILFRVKITCKFGQEGFQLAVYTWRLLGQVGLYCI